MPNGTFTYWERVIVALNRKQICGFCTVSRTNCIPNVSYTPYIGYIFVDDKFRGNRLNQKMIQFSMVYIVSDHDKLHEKYEFEIIKISQKIFSTTSFLLLFR